MKPIVALVGRPNVGKSTLFNVLTKTRDALVADFPGLTRDRKYGMASHNGQEYIVIDTGGLEGGEEGIEYKMVEQSLLAIEEADMVFFLVDAKIGLLPGDQVIAEYLRKRQKPTIIVANKIDGVNVETQVPEFYELAIGEIFPIAASQNKGIQTLIEDGLFQTFNIDATQQWGYQEQDDGELNEENIRQLDQDQLAIEIDQAHDISDHQIKIALIGRPNVGKSTLTNSLLNEERVIVYDEPGTTRDSTYIPLEVHGNNYVLIDTAGVRKKSKVFEVIEKFSVVKTLQAIEDANVCCLIIDAQQGITDQDLSLLGFILNAGRSVVILINKWDSISKGERDLVKDELDRRLGFIDFARIHFISALKGHGVGQVLDLVREAYASAMIKINTSMVTKILEMLVDNHQPPMVNGRRIKLKYAHVGGHNPPIIVIHGTQLNKLPPSYKKYIVNYFLRTLKIYGTPIKIKYQEGSNPYQGIKNKLSASQLRKKKRLMKFAKRD